MAATVPVLHSAHDDLDSPTVTQVLLQDSPLSAPLAPFARSHDRASSSSSLLSYEKDPFRNRISSIIEHDSPYGHRVSSMVDKYSLSPDPRLWGSELRADVPEDDDDLHKPDDEKAYTRIYRDSDYMSIRGLANLGCVILLVVCIVGLFAGYPIASHLASSRWDSLGGFNLGGINSTGQIPDFPGNRGLIDVDTPKDAYTAASWQDGSDMELVWSDEFEVEGRTFYPGDDPYWEAVDLHYWPTNNFEWYDPAAITTHGGSLVITLSKREEHDLHYQGGMLQTWNKFCFTGGLVQTNVMLPGVNNIMGLWPAVWTMGNLGRAGYGATTDGMWPYSYDSCDVGTMPNQTKDGLPAAALVNGDQGNGGVLSFLPGQRLSRCTCDEDADLHPGPKHSDNTFVGRSAPEIDVFEAQITDGIAQVSQSAQFAPFNAGYSWDNTTGATITDPRISYLNTFKGSVVQQATSVVTQTNQICYEYEGQCFSIYSFEYQPGFSDAYITWISNNQVAWTLTVDGVGADPATEISARSIPQEPMYLIANLGMSTNFGTVDLDHLPFPVHMYIDYIRVYQRKGQRNIGCDPHDFPTAQYIERYNAAYTNANYTTWTGDPSVGGFGQTFPRNSFAGEC